MADENEFRVERGITPREREMIAGDARWAETFGAGSTNLAQRQRYQEAISEERGIRAQEKEEAFGQRLATDKGARDLYFKEQSSNLARTKAIHDMDLKQRKFQMDAERFPLQMDNERLELKVHENALDTAVKKKARDASIALRTDTQTDAFEESIQSLIDDPNSNPHSRAFAEGLAKAYAANPYADKNVVKQWFANSRIEVEPEELLTMLGEIDKDPRAAGKNITVTRGQNGFSITARPKAAGTERTKDTVQNELDKVRVMFGKTMEPSTKAYFESRIRQLEGEVEGLGGVSGPKPAGATPAPVEQTPAAVSEAPSKPIEFQNDPEGYKKAYAESNPGTVFIYNGKKVMKPEAK